MFEQIAYEHGADLRRAAAVARRHAVVPAPRSATRADRATPRLARRLSDRVRVGLLHRSAACVGCEA